MPIPGDLRAWDELLRGPTTVGVEAETVLGDIQAQVREMAAKQRDSRVARMILLVRGSHRNRAMIAEQIVTLRLTFPLDTRQTLRALSRGRDPGGNGVVIL